jgi:glycosyltransferase involved in cell wall biosynthesis
VTAPPISVLVPCFNSEAVIEACLQSVSWADEIVVCDSFSSDRTIEIAERYANRVIRHEYVDSASQKNWAIPQLAHHWVLIVDTDERVPPDLRREIEYAVHRPCGFTGFRIPRANYVFGRRLEHGGEWPDYQLRLFRRDKARYEHRRVHARMVLEGPCGTLTTPLTHLPHQSLPAIRRTLLGRYARWEAEQKQADGARFSLLQLATRPAGAFLTRYILRSGYRDSWQGLLMATIWACYVFISYWNLRALGRASSS